MYINALNRIRKIVTSIKESYIYTRGKKVSPCDLLQWLLVYQSIGGKDSEEKYAFLSCNSFIGKQ